MQDLCGKLQIKQNQAARIRFRSLPKEQPPPLHRFLTFYMETTENRLAPKIDFWKGIVLGTLAGMAIAAYTYSIADTIAGRSFKEPDQAPLQNTLKPGEQAAA